MRLLAIAQMLLHNVNVPRMLCEHLVGDHHSHRHRCAVGTVVMVIGVFIAKSAGHSHVELFEFAGDMFGYLVHGVGAVPYVEGIIATIRVQNNEP